MTTLADLRSNLTEALKDVGAPVSGHLPDRFVPPVAVLVQGDPYLDSGPTYGAVSVRFQLVLIAGSGTNEAVTASLDALIESAFDLITDSADFFVESIDQPALYKHGQGTFLSSVVSIRVDTRLGG